MMKSAGILAVSMAAVNAISSATTFKSTNPYHQDGGAAKQKQRDYSSDKFAPRFDGCDSSKPSSLLTDNASLSKH